MKEISSNRQILIIIIVFIISRILALLLGLHLNEWALLAYWQYLDIDTLQHHLLTGVWYDHAQPPVFNLLLGVVLKIGGKYSMLLFAILLKGISLANSLLLFSILGKLTEVRYIPLITALVYMLSPATLIFECELFYTTTVSFCWFRFIT
jgi:hypothetical protein